MTLQFMQKQIDTITIQLKMIPESHESKKINFRLVLFLNITILFYAKFL